VRAQVLPGPPWRPRRTARAGRGRETLRPPAPPSTQHRARQLATGISRCAAKGALEKRGEGAGAGRGRSDSHTTNKKHKLPAAIGFAVGRSADATVRVVRRGQGRWLSLGNPAVLVIPLPGMQRRRKGQHSRYHFGRALLGSGRWGADAALGGASFERAARSFFRLRGWKLRAAGRPHPLHKKGRGKRRRRTLRPRVKSSRRGGLGPELIALPRPLADTGRPAASRYSAPPPIPVLLPRLRRPLGGREGRGGRRQAGDAPPPPLLTACSTCRGP